MPILWLKLIFIINIFPGIFYQILKNFYFFKRLKSYNVYLISLTFAVLLGLTSFNNLKLIFLLLLMIVVPICYFIFEKIFFIKRDLFYAVKWDLHMFVFVILFPMIEELNFRQIIFIEMNYFKYGIYLYLIISVGSFLITHILYKGINSLYKIPFAIFQSLIFIYTNNIFILIIIHIIFNIIVLIDNIRIKSNNY